MYDHLISIASITSECVAINNESDQEEGKRNQYTK